jgi:hypothetical protein
MLSISGLCKSIFTSTSGALTFNSSREPKTSISSHLSHCQIGIDVPQYLALEIGQSEIESNQLSNLSFAHSGYQFTSFSFISFNLSFKDSVFKNHCGSAT